jgi:phosphoenolpyruvate carboxykinase (ATP)
MASDLTHWLEHIGIRNCDVVFHNPDRSTLVTEALLKDEGVLSHTGALVVDTTPYTGRSPDDKYIVDYGDRKDLWFGDVNQKITPENFEKIQRRITAYLNNRRLFVIDSNIGADKAYQLRIRLVTEYAWQALAGQNLFIYDGLEHQQDPDIVILAAPSFNTTPSIDSVRSKAAICIDLRKKIILIAGSKYAGEIKKSAFTIMNALLPESQVLPMHCSANVGDEGDVALFFGLSGTGKTTLSSTPDRKLIGDDEHGWGKNGIFNFEGGCYAKTIRLKQDLEPVIWKAANQFGTVLENVYLDPKSLLPHFDDSRLTENTRAAYPLSMVDHTQPGGTSGHPDHVFFLTADAFGVMPPVASLTKDEAIFYFLSGYTSKVAGTERGLGKQPRATFSTCFGEPFLPLTPNIYAKLLEEKITQYQSRIWLINTGWTAGDYNSGHRMPLPHTRNMVSWILSGAHEGASFHQDPTFGLQVPDHIPNVPDEYLHPRQTWTDKTAFDRIAAKLKRDFDQNFEKFIPYLD